jgi:hypothetical protein
MRSSGRTFSCGQTARNSTKRPRPISRSSTITATCRRWIRGEPAVPQSLEIWLEGDHYKWRAMRPTAFPSVRGEAAPYTGSFGVGGSPALPRNPYHWTHLELQRFGMKGCSMSGPRRRLRAREREQLPGGPADGRLSRSSTCARSPRPTILRTRSPRTRRSARQTLRPASIRRFVRPRAGRRSARRLPWIDRLSQLATSTSPAPRCSTRCERHQDFHDAGCRADPASVATTVHGPRGRGGFEGPVRILDISDEREASPA